MTTSGTTKKPHPFAMFHVYFLLVFLVLFPKGGFKAGGTPLTWGYLYLALSAPLLALVRLLAKPLRVRGTALGITGLLVPMQILLVYAYANQGISNVGYAVSMVAAIFFLPWMFLLVYPSFFDLVNPERTSACFRFCMLAAASWGILLFFTHPFTGHYFQIPYLTVNAADYGLLETTKYNARGFYQKLIATYNNGNVYGVATLIILPMYNQLEPKRWKRGVLLAATLLTLSRTVWVGLVIMQVAPLAIVLVQQLDTFPVIYLGAAGKRIVSLSLILGLIFVVLFLTTNSGLEFILDPSLGGRAGELSQVDRGSFLPIGGLEGFDESVYGSASRYYGATGLVAFSMIMASPLFLLLADPSALRSKIRMAAFSGLVLYAVIAASDGAFVLIPVMAFYWFAYAVFLYGWPGTRRASAQRVRRASTDPANSGLLLEPS